MKPMKPPAWTVILLFVIISAYLIQPSFAQSSQVSSTVSLQYADVQVSYPQEVLPGETITVSFLLNAKDTFHIITVTVKIYYADGNNLKQLANATLAKQTSTYTRNQITQDVQITVPQDAPRTALIALLSEKVRTSNYNYYPYPYYYPSYFPNYTYNYLYYPPDLYNITTDSAVAPLSYIKAATPEFASLQSEYQMLQQQLAQSQADNQRLQQNLQTQQNDLAQRDATIANLNQQIASAQNTTNQLQITSLVLGGIVVALVAFLAMGRIRQLRKTTKEEGTKRPSKPKTTHEKTETQSESSTTAIARTGEPEAFTRSGSAMS